MRGHKIIFVDSMPYANKMVMRVRQRLVIITCDNGEGEAIRSWIKKDWPRTVSSIRQ